MVVIFSPVGGYSAGASSVGASSAGNIKSSRPESAGASLSPGAEQLRELLVTGDADRWSAEAEALLNYAARDDHLRRVIRPA